MPSFDYNPLTRNLDLVGATASGSGASHNRQHHIDSTADHIGVAGAVENNFISFNANGLPKDSGYSDSDFSSHWDRVGTVLSQKIANDDIHYGSGTISGTGDIHCNDLYASGSSVHVGNSVISSSDRGQVMFNRMTHRQDDFTLRSNFGAGTWTARDSNRLWNSIAMTADGVTQVACVNNGDIYKSIDAGKNWSSLSAGNIGWYDIAISADGRVIACCVASGQTRVSIDYGENFSAVGPSGLFYCLAMSSDGSKLALAEYGGYIHISTDFGQSWSQKAFSDSWYGLEMSADGGIITASNYGDKIYVSIDGGNSWNGKDSNRNWRQIGMSDDGAIQAAAVWGGNIYVSTDFGDTWAAKGDSKQWNDIKVSYDGKNMIASASDGVIGVSTDYGENWSTVATLSPVLIWLATTPTFSKISGTSWNDNIFTTYCDVDIESDVNFQGSIAITDNLTIDSTSVDEFSTDGTFAGNSDTALPTEKAVKTYVDATVSGGAGVTDHGALTGLSDDDHTQYFITTGARSAEYVNIAGNVDDSPMTKEGLQLRVSAANLTDNFTPGLRAKGSANSFGIPTMIGDNSVTITDASTVYIDGAPVEGVLMTITNPWSLYVNTGNVYIGGDIIANNVINNNLYVGYEPTPTSSGTQGQKYFGSGYLYECVATNTWVRYSVATTW